MVSTQHDGSDWDASAGGTAAPDLFVTIAVNGTVAATTTTVDDSYSASWTGPYSVSLIAGSTLVLSSYDEDLTSDDPGYACEAMPLTAADLRGHQLVCNDSGANAWSMSFQIAPQ